MGSISYAIPYGSNARAEVAKYVRENYRGEVVASNFAAGDPGGSKYGGWGGTYFTAIRDEDGTVYAGVTLFSQYQGDVVIKALDETVGPTAIGVGPKVLKALTPLPADAHEWQVQWREAAQRYQERRKAAFAAKGKVINLAQPVKLRSGAEVDKVEVVDIRLWRTVHGTRIRPFADWYVSDWTLA